MKRENSKPGIYTAALLAVLAVFLQISLHPTPSYAANAGEERFALVIGNGDYQKSPLPNAVNDARAVTKALRSAGFEVSTLTNATRTETEREIIRFGRRLRQSRGVGLFYYAGHAVQVGGRNYLIPIGNRIETPEEIRVESVDLEYVLARMDAAANDMNMVILDACRVNPFGFDRLSVSTGLASVDAPIGTLLAYATAPGKVAADGGGKNGVYTQQLVKAMNAPGIKVEDFFKQVRRNVAKVTGGKQVPWESSSLINDFYFNPTQKNLQASSPQTEVQTEAALWESARKGFNPVLLEAYLSRYPDGANIPIAKRRLAKVMAMAAKSASSSGLRLDFKVASLNKNMTAVKTANLRQQPSVNSPKVGVAVLGSSIRVTGQTQASGKLWYRVLRNDGSPGYIYGPLLDDGWGLSLGVSGFSPEAMALIMSAVAVLLLFLGVPTAFTLGATAFAAGMAGYALNMFDARLLETIPLQIQDALLNDALIAIPLFIFMGDILIRSKLAHQLLEAMEFTFRRFRGGLSLSALLIGALLAGTTGTVGALVVTLGMTTLPFMLRAGYDKSLAGGTVLAAGTLGQLIPPSIILVILGDVLHTANANVLRDVGDWKSAPISAGDLFAGILVPGLLAVLLMLVWIWAKSKITPESCPAVTSGRARKIKAWRLFVRLLIPPVLLIMAVLGSILLDIATPTEAAGLGAIGAILLAGRKTKTARRKVAHASLLGTTHTPVKEKQSFFGSLFSRMSDGNLAADAKLTTNLPAGFELRGDMHAFAAGMSLFVLFFLSKMVPVRLPASMGLNIELATFLAACFLVLVFIWGFIVCCYRASSSGVLAVSMRNAAQYSSMVFVTFLGATIFVIVFQGFNGDDLTARLFAALPGGQLGTIAAVMVLLFFLGFVLDTIGIMFLFVPIFAPVLFQMGADPIWLGIVIVFTLQVSFLTPPLGFSFGYLRRLRLATVTQRDLNRGVLPFLAIQVLVLILIVAFPKLATWLPTWLNIPS